ncbi:GIY-YIG nuclease family protein [soil metagenome]
MEQRELFFTYILHCADNTYYIGKTIDLKKRLRQHNGEISGGAKYTRVRRPVKLSYSETYETLSEALKREIKLKKLTHQQKKQLIQRNIEL